MSQKLPNMLESTIEKVRGMVDANSVVGEPIVAGDVTMIPVSKISIGLGGGGSDFTTKIPNQEQPFGGGMGPRRTGSVLVHRQPLAAWSQ